MPALWLALVAATASGDADYERVREVAVQLEAARAWDAAIRQWRLARLVAPPDEALTVGRRVCFLLERWEGVAAARTCYEDLGDPTSALRAIALQKDAQQPRELLRLIVAAPETEAARQALVRLQAVAPDPARALLDVTEQVRPSPTPSTWSPHTRTLVANAWVELARLTLAAGDPRRALAILEGAEAVIDATTWWDDALYLRGQAAAQAGDLVGALNHYTALIERRETSFFVGTYDSEFYDDAFFEKVRLLLALGRSDEARAVVAEMRKKVPTSRLLDDAERLWEARRD